MTFNATGTAAAAANIAVHAGDNQSVTVNTNVTAPSVLVTDTYGNPISGVSVTFAVATGGGSATGLSRPRTAAASQPSAAGRWAPRGPNTLTATSGSLSGSPVTFNATGTADLLDHLVLSPASASISADVGSQTYTAEGRDQYGNSLGDATGSTVFTVTGGSCTGAACTVTTAGSARSRGTLLGSTGNATLIITAGAAANIALQTGDAQSATVNTSVATAPSVLVTDAHGNPVSGTTVTFAVASGGGSVTGGGATTNASGIATVGSWTLGTTAGTGSLTATRRDSRDADHVPRDRNRRRGQLDRGQRGQQPERDREHERLHRAFGEVTDSFGNAVSGTSVTFAVGSGGGSLTGGSATTNATASQPSAAGRSEQAPARTRSAPPPAA